LVIELHTHH